MKAYLNKRALAAFVVAAVLAVIGVFALIFSNREKQAEIRDADYSADGSALEIVSFADIDGWRLDRLAEALPAFLRSCGRIEALAATNSTNPSELLGPAANGATLAGTAADWVDACEQAKAVESQRYADESARSSAARAFFEFNFTPVKVSERLKAANSALPPKIEPFGRFTAYFEPFYPASRQRTALYSAPVYARPDDLVTVDLGQFRPELAGQRIAGRVSAGVLEPYPDHAAINAGALVDKARVLAWMQPTDLLFLQIQGSGRLAFADGEIRVGYDGANGHPYTAIGRTLVERGALALELVSMKTIQEWLDKAPADDARSVRESNASYVFFRSLDALPDADLGPIGAEGLQLTPGRSLAVDPRYVAYGAPVWVSIAGDPEKNKSAVRRLMIAQDTGGAIKGPGRGDVFVGSGPLAGEVAGTFNEMGEMYVLAPRPVVDRLRRALNHETAVGRR